MASTVTISQALEGITFPCGKAGIVAYARAHNADPAALDVLGGLPEQSYGGIAEVFRGIALARGQPRWAEARPVPTEEPEPATLEGQIEAAHPHPTDIAPQRVHERPEHARRKGFLQGLRRLLGYD